MTGLDPFKIVGSVIGADFKVERLVAEGGFSAVYRGFHTRFRVPVALKCLKLPAQLDATQRARFAAQFQQEAELLFRLSASRREVVRPLQVGDFATVEGQYVPFLALEWLEGRGFERALGERLERGLGGYPLVELVQRLGGVAAALERAHALPGPTGPLSVVHRDLKPDNLLLLDDGGVKILDYGISTVKLLTEQIAGAQVRGDASAVLGFTPGFAAPEQWCPELYGQTGPWTDVWGLALTMVELSVGRPVIDGDHEAMRAQATASAPRPTPRALGLAVSDAVEAVFGKALSVDPRLRYHGVADFWGELTRALGLEPPRTAPGGEEPVAPETLESEPPAVALPALELMAPPGWAPPALGQHPRTLGREPARWHGGGAAARGGGRAAERWWGGPALCLLGCFAVLLVDQVHSRHSARPLLGDVVRPSWIAGLLLAVGLGWGLRRWQRVAGGRP